jgi:hypothetical protein
MININKSVELQNQIILVTDQNDRLIDRLSNSLELLKIQVAKTRLILNLDEGTKVS